MTAGASGIGKEIVKVSSNTGANLFIYDIDAEALSDTSQALPGVVTKVCDISDRKASENMVSYGAKQPGGFDVLVNNAVIAGLTDPVNGKGNGCPIHKQFVDRRDIAALAVFLAPGAAKMISGQR